MKVKPMIGSYELPGIERIESAESRSLVEHGVPGLEGNYLQDMGSVPNTIVIVGTRHGDADRDDFLTAIRELFNSREPTTFVADINTATDVTDVVIEDLQVVEIGGGADSFRYLVKIRKYIEPPEPPATGLLDGGILDDALGLAEILDAIDALGSISNLGDPTVPLRDSLDGVRAATGGLDQTVSALRDLLGEGNGAIGGGAAPTPGVPPGAAPGPGPTPGAGGPGSEAGAGAASEPVASAGELQIDPEDPRIDAGARSGLQALLDAPETAEEGARLARGINGGTLAGIAADDSDVVERLAGAHGTDAASLVPSAQDAALVLDAASPLEAPPTIVFRSGVPEDPARFGRALEEAARTFALFEQGELGRCDSTPSAIPIPNLVPASFCRVPAAVPAAVEPVEEKHITRGLVGMFFETDKTFLLPSAMRSIRRLNQFYKDNPGGELLVVGHTDTVGPQDYNLKLSKRRAANMAAYLDDRIEIWTAYYQPQPISKLWGTREDQHMLSVLPEGGEPFYTDRVDGIADPNTKKAVTQFQEFSNANRGTTLTVDGIAGPSTRHELVKAYMELDGTSLPQGTPLFSQGCGEFHPEVPTGDEVEEAQNRRVEVLFFPDRIDPPMPAGGCQAPGCIEYPQWRNRATRTIDFTSDAIRIEIVEEITERPLAGLSFLLQLPGGEVRPVSTDANGVIEVGDAGGTSILRSILAEEATIETTWHLPDVEQPAASALFEAAAAVPLSVELPPEVGQSRVHVAMIEAHRVRTGETLDSIASEHGLTRSALVKFNVGSEEPEAVREYLFDVVGSTFVDASDEPLLRDSDQPGVVHVPTQVERPLEAGVNHRLRLRIVQHGYNAHPLPVYMGVLADGVSVLDRPEPGGSKIGTLAKGQLIRILEERLNNDRAFVRFVGVESSQKSIDSYVRGIREGPEEWFELAPGGVLVADAADAAGSLLSAPDEEDAPLVDFAPEGELGDV